MDGVVNQNYDQRFQPFYELQTDHECICKGDGCNKDWGAAGETGEQTTGAPAEDLRVICLKYQIDSYDVFSAMFANKITVVVCVMLKTLALWSLVQWEMLWDASSHNIKMRVLARMSTPELVRTETPMFVQTMLAKREVISMSVFAKKKVAIKTGQVLETLRSRQQLINLC